MRAVLFALAAALSAATPTVACVYGPGHDPDREIIADMATVTAIYEGRIEHVVQGSWAGAWDFNVRATRSLWGEAPPPIQQFTWESGACTNFLFITHDNEDAPPEGREVVIFATPEGAADSIWLYIVRAGSPTAAFMFERFGDTPAGRQFRAIR